jgi:hypothetical protein
MKLSKKQTRNLVARFWIFEGRLPAGTNNENFDAVTMQALQLDDPPVPGAPDFEHKKFAEMLTQQFNKLLIAVPGILGVLKVDTNTMKDLWSHCFDNQEVIEDLFG